MICWKCGGEHSLSEARVVEKKESPEAVQIKWVCSCGVVNHFRHIDRVQGVRYLAVFGSRHAVTPTHGEMVKEIITRREFDVLVMGGSRGAEVFAARAALEMGKRVIVVLPFDLQGHPDKAALFVLKNLPREDVIEHPEWANPKHPIYASDPRWDYSPLAPFRARDMEIVFLATEVLVFEVEGENWGDLVKEVKARGKPVEEILLPRLVHLPAFAQTEEVAFF